MAKIEQYLKRFMDARHGRDVKQDFHDCVLEINNEVIESVSTAKNTEARQNLLEKKYNEQIANIAATEPQNAEIVDARQGFDSLGSLLKRKVYFFEKVDAMRNCLTLTLR